MKKTILLFVLILFIYIFIGFSFNKKVVIPDEAIRVRVIANSNSEYDQDIKKKVRNVLYSNLTNILKNDIDINSFRKTIVNNISTITKNIKELLEDNKYDLGLDVNYGLNYFPKKEFKGVVYDEGYYESLVITLGNGLGDNWWCVLFPPLCLIEATEMDNVQYTTLVEELINKYF